MKCRVLSLVLLLLCSIPGLPARADDALDEALALAGLERGDLGWTPKGWWPRFPHVPYKLRAFDALFAAVEAREGFVTECQVDPIFATLHSDPRWDELLRRMGF